MPFIPHTHAVPKINLLQWSGTASDLSDLQAYVDQLLANRPWADAAQTVPPRQITLTKNANNTLTITAGSSAVSANVGDWIGEIKPAPLGEWLIVIYPDASKKRNFDVAK